MFKITHVLRHLDGTYYNGNLHSKWSFHPAEAVEFSTPQQIQEHFEKLIKENEDNFYYMDKGIFTIETRFTII